MKVSQLQAVELPAEVPFGDETIKLRFRPGAYTGSFLDGLADQALADALATVLCGWDLQNEDGTPYPITQEAIAALPIPFLRAAFRKIHEAAFPN